MVARSSSAPVFEPDAVAPIDPKTLHGVDGLSVMVFDPSDDDFCFTTNTESALAGADVDVGSLKDTVGSGTAFATGTASLRPTRRTDGTYWWLEADGTNALAVSGSAALFKHLHDGTGGEIMAGARFGTTDNPDVLMTLLDNCNISLGNVGVSLYYDDRSGSKRNDHFHHLAANSNTSLPAKNTSIDNAVKANQDCVVGASFKAKSGDEGTVSVDGKTFHSSQINTASTANATYSLLLFRRAGGADFYMTGRLYYLCIINGVLTEAQRAGVDAYIASKMPRAANETKLHSFDAGSRVEWFIDKTNVDASSGVNFDVQRLEKHESNPLIPADTPDADTYYPTALKVADNDFRAWIGAVPDITDPYDNAICGYYTSPTGLDDWTKPNLGQVTIGGNTNNNLISTLGYDTTIHPDGVGGFVAMEGAPLGAGSVGDEKGRIKISSDGITNWTLVKTLDPAAFHPGLFQFEFHGLAHRSDGRWVAYYTFDHDAYRRSIAAYVSDTTDPAGAWTHIGLLTNLEAELNYAQFYNFSATLIHGILYGVACRFDQFTQRIWVDLYTSPGNSGTVWTPAKGMLIPTARVGAGAYDGGMVVAKNITNTDAETRIYYTGSVQTHSGGSPLRDSRLCMARLATGRLGVVYGAGGTVTTTAFTATEGLKVNANSSGGNLKVELLDPADDSVLTGYAKADCDSLDGNYLAKVVTWGGLSIPTDQSVKLKFYLDS